jgi:hypothetical protein
MDTPDGNQAWLWLSFVAVVCLSINTLLIAKLRDSGIKPELLALYWFMLVGGGLAVALVLEGNSLLLPAIFLPPHRWWPTLVLACAGLAGTVANGCFFSAAFYHMHADPRCTSYSGSLRRITSRRNGLSKRKAGSGSVLSIPRRKCLVLLPFTTWSIRFRQSK